jgi:hypothetical protein
MQQLDETEILTAYKLRLKDVMEHTGVSLQTLINWRKNKKQLYCTVVAGVNAQRRRRKNDIQC